MYICDYSNSFISLFEAASVDEKTFAAKSDALCCTVMHWRKALWRKAKSVALWHCGEKPNVMHAIKVTKHMHHKTRKHRHHKAWEGNTKHHQRYVDFTKHNVVPRNNQTKHQWKWKSLCIVEHAPYCRYLLAELKHCWQWSNYVCKPA